MTDADDATRPIGSPRAALPPVPGAGSSRSRWGARAAAGSGDGAAARPRGFGAALALTVANAVVPGSGLLAAGRRRTGLAVLAAFLVLVGAAVWLVTAGRRTAVGIAVDPGQLRWLLAGVVAVAVLWVAVVIVGYRVLMPRPASWGRHAVGGLLVVALVAAVGYPAYLVGQVAVAQTELIEEVFADDRESATVVDEPDPFGDQERVNVLLLGGDGGEGREGVRTDTVVVASIDTDSGDTVLFSLPRNLEDLPFPEDSPLAEVYPDGFDAGSESESLLNAVYRNGPAMYPDILGPTDDPGADFLKLGVGEALGLDIDYFVLVNLDGFARLVDALGGITVNVNYYVPINGIEGGELPDDYIEPGRDQHMDGQRALAFARGRYGLSDYLRMERQRCVIDAIIDEADPITLLRDYQELAAATRDILSTDIPRSALQDFVDLGDKVKEGEVTSVVFDNTVINPAYPNYDAMRFIVLAALSPDSSSPGTTTPEPTDPTDPTATDPPPGGEVPVGPVADIGNACAYDPVQAAAALEAGEPPNQAD
ncbi:LCP family protein [Trujillonella endophytica]|uniref:Transcriptional attenuator, LytR family n=1 Tax=Trujillonella endophytica TaxID=673521 RepID=A0A1H8U9M2_9ACTN|nr:LCP family protein [Trujillella endophytica]SEO99737.1 transcriptional attenuator, LytR family [Trujillella endophytica]